MNRPTIMLLLLCTFILIGCGGQSMQDTQTGGDLKAEERFKENLENNRQWSSFRGYYARGYLDNANLPDRWNMETGENVKWKIPIPGLGLSCPVIWDETVFITTAISEEG